MPPVSFAGDGVGNISRARVLFDDDEPSDAIEYTTYALTATTAQNHHFL